VKRFRLAAVTAALALVHGLATAGPRVVDFETPPQALGMTAGTTITYLLLGSRLVAVLALPVGAALVGYRAGDRVDLRTEYRGVLAALAAGGAVGGFLGGVLPGASVGGPLLGLLTAVGGALEAAVGFALAGFAGAALAHVRATDHHPDGGAGEDPTGDPGPDDARDVDVDHDRYRPDDAPDGQGTTGD
jgi:hypothetical protein